MAAPQVFNPGNRGQSARYDISGLPEVRPGVFSDGVYEYDSNGLSLNRPDTYVEGLPGADNMNGWTPGAGAPSGGGGDGSGMFASPYFQQYQSQNAAADAADLSDMKSQLSQLLVQFGLVPKGFQDRYGAIDDTVRGLIEQNTKSGISHYARLLEGKEDTRRETIGRLGSRGLLRSGAKGFRLRRNQLDFDRTFSDTLNAVLGNANQLQSGYANRALQRQQGLSQFLSQLFSNWRPTGGGGGGGASQPSPFQMQQPTYSPQASQPGVPFFDVGGGNQMAGGALRASRDLLFG